MSAKHIVTIALITLFCAHPSWAEPAQDEMSKCLTDSTTGKDRKDLARWIFTVMTLHPEVSSISSVTPEMRAATDKTAGMLLSRLMTKDCRAQFIAQYKNDPQSVKDSFEGLGRMAMQELVANPNVTAGMSGFMRYMDMKALQTMMLQSE